MPIRWKVVKSRYSCCARGKFALHYVKGVIKAVPNTLGIMVFDTFENACLFNSNRFSIITVKSIGRGKKRPTISAQTGIKGINGFYAKDRRTTIRAPRGTICYPAVEVLE